ncbi:hypothetical protein LY78DRAFT_49332 [Colletotrichum sublineola]|nr:hypothetical protein LY78DRAFT_49332 [Colletotrichum sublineola]
MQNEKETIPDKRNRPLKQSNFHTGYIRSAALADIAGRVATVCGTWLVCTAVGAAVYDSDQDEDL